MSSIISAFTSVWTEILQFLTSSWTSLLTLFYADGALTFVGVMAVIMAGIALVQVLMINKLTLAFASAFFYSHTASMCLLSIVYFYLSLVLLAFNLIRSFFAMRG